MSKALSVAVRYTGHLPVNGMWDFEFTLADGTLGAGEMTRITFPESQQWLAVNASKEPRITGSQLVWVVRPRRAGVGPRPPLAMIVEHLEVLAPVAESLAERPRSRLLDGDRRVRAHPSLLWFKHNDLELETYATTISPGRVVLESPSVWGFTSPTLVLALEWIEGQLGNDPRYTRKLEKLERSGRPEQHLVLRLDHEGMPPEIWLFLRPRR